MKSDCLKDYNSEICHFRLATYPDAIEGILLIYEHKMKRKQRRIEFELGTMGSNFYNVKDYTMESSHSRPNLVKH